LCGSAARRPLAIKGDVLPYLTPTIVKRISPTRTEITWNDGHESPYPSWYLRENCPCALCVEEFTGVRKVAEGSIPGNLERVMVEPVGNYALHFEWSDGHSTGIYTFDHLRKLCPCPQCRPQGLEEPPPEVRKPGSFEV
jgi:DUF971 family protein